MRTLFFLLYIAATSCGWTQMNTQSCTEHSLGIHIGAGNSTRSPFANQIGIRYTRLPKDRLRLSAFLLYDKTGEAFSGGNQTLFLNDTLRLVGSQREEINRFSLQTGIDYKLNCFLYVGASVFTGLNKMNVTRHNYAAQRDSVNGLWYSPTISNWGYAYDGGPRTNENIGTTTEWYLGLKSHIGIQVPLNEKMMAEFQYTVEVAKYYTQATDITPSYSNFNTDYNGRTGIKHFLDCTISYAFLR